MTTKLSIAKKLFDLEKDSILNSTSFKKFLSENEVSFEKKKITHHFLTSCSWSTFFCLSVFACDRNG